MKPLSRVRFFDWRVCKDRSTREENWIPSSRPRILSPLLWRRVCNPSTLSAASFSVSAKPVTSHSHYLSSADKTYPQPDLSVLLTEQCYLIEWCQNPESGFLSTSKSCNFYFKNTSPALHFYFQCHLFFTVSCLHYISSRLSFSQSLFLLSQQPILHTAAGGLIKLLI